MLRIVEEDLRGCLGTRENTSRFFVIDMPINETGICRQFNTRIEAEAFMADKEKSPGKRD